MNDNQNAIQPINEDFFNLSFDELENSLDADLEESLADLELLKEDREKIGNPDSLSETVMNVVWEQFVNQVGAVAGEEFIRENRGMKLDLRNSAHIQTTENFEKGKIASHNSQIDYQDRYDNWQSKLAHDEHGEIITYTDRSGKPKARLAGPHVRKPFDDGRPTGSVEKGTDMDHTISAAEIIRDSRANAHLSEKEQIDFANSDANLNEMNSSHNRSKSDMAMSEWLDNPNKNGQKPDEIFDDLDENLKASYRKKDEEAREEYDRVKQEGEQRSIDTGKKSQRQEAARMGKKALQGIAMGLLAALVKTIFQKFAVWLKSKQKSLSSFFDKVKEAISNFVKDLKSHLKIAAQSAIGTLASMIFGPIVRTLQKAWTFIKQGYKSLKEAIAYIKNPVNKKKPFSIMMMEVGKIIIAGLTAAGAIVLGGAIEGGLSTVPFFAFEIPMLGSLASILGLFLGGLISGIIGAIALNLIDKWIAKKQKNIKTGEIIHQKSKILDVQNKLIVVSEAHLEKSKLDTAQEIVVRHQAVADLAKSKISEIESDLYEICDESYRTDITPSQNSVAIKDLFDDIESL
ncbi:MAG: cation diffusion facilitator family transporter [Muribaculaceae bacterium]|nr:cation diffusion facilitator family transporter [Muribaculaceae bacterium]MDE6522454.1 cation diffusion facilitator family transporter [Muribaculaceae bacterium]